MTKACPRCGFQATHGGSLATHVRWCGKTEERFWAKVDKSAGPDGCWPWTALLDRYGYGLFALPKTKAIKLVVVTAHRFSWKLAHGDAGDLHVLHTCDNPKCVNPAHLSLGTHRDNMADKLLKGRCQSKLTLAQVHEMREAFKTPYRGQGRDLAKKYGVTEGQIAAIRTGRRWAYV